MCICADLEDAQTGQDKHDFGAFTGQGRVARGSVEQASRTVAERHPRQPKVLTAPPQATEDDSAEQHYVYLGRSP
jgi:hypothetical protein